MIKLPTDVLPGGAIDMPDLRDYQAEHILGVDDKDIPEKMRLDIDEGDQGDSTMCTCYATYHVAQVANELEHKSKLEPNFYQGWELQKKFGTYNKQGDYVQTALNSLKKHGFLTVNNGVFPIEGYARINQNEIRDWISKKYAIVTSGPVTSTNFKKAKYDGVWTGLDGDRVGGHAFTIIGYEPGYIIVSNSYGSTWGFYKDGTFKIADKDIKALGTCYIIYDKKDLKYLYKDVTDKSPHYESIKWCKEQGLMHGYQDGRFGPNDPLTRAQFAEVMYRKFNS